MYTGRGAVLGCQDEFVNTVAIGIAPFPQTAGVVAKAPTGRTMLTALVIASSGLLYLLSAGEFT